jgi:hypothetical protein
MKMHVRWGRAIKLRDGSRENLIYVPDTSKLPKAPGVYVFGRRQKNGSFEALYVGMATSIRSRVWGQRKNLPLMMHLKKAKQGKRVVRAAVFEPRPGQKVRKCLPLLERALIRYFLSEGHDLVNKMGARLGRHEVSTNGRHPNRFIPRLMFVD